MAAQVRSDHPEAVDRLREDVLPVVAAAGEAVQEQERLAAPAVAIEQVEAVDGIGLRHDADYRRRRVLLRSRNRSGHRAGHSG